MIEEPQVDPEDLAPDADDDGDGFPQELADLVHEGDITPDEVDKPDPEEKASEEEGA